MKLRYFIPFIFAGLTLTACDLFSGNKGSIINTNKGSITLSETSLTLNVGESRTLTATVQLPSNSQLSEKVYFKAETGNILTVGKSTGKVIVKSTAQGGQSEKVIAYLKDDNTITATCKVTVNKINPTSITLDQTSLEIGAGRFRQLTVSYSPSNANANKDVTWTTSNSKVATVSAGKVTVKSTATPGQTATITAKLTNLPSITASCNLTVSDTTSDAWTVLLYMCGSTLEADYANVHTDGISFEKCGLATCDIKEIISVQNKPDDVNIVIETGGANEWTNNAYGKYSDDYSISSSFIQRHHVENGKIILDQGQDKLTNTKMAYESTLQSFVEYGLEKYPAEKTALILWNHGGGMQGVCFADAGGGYCDSDGLEGSEVANAVKNALSNCGMAGKKLEFIGYDACLMQVQDLAELNSPYFKYMIGSQQLENGEGWDYDTWLDDLYAGKSTETILKAIVDGFISENGGTQNSRNDQTLSYLNLSYVSEYKTAWENMAIQLKNKITSSNKNDFNELVKKATSYEIDDYGLVDAKDFISELVNNSTFNPGSTYTDAILAAHSNFVEYSSCGGGAGDSYGVSMYWSVSRSCKNNNPYTAGTDTNFINWAYLSNTYYGSSSSGGGGGWGW